MLALALEGNAGNMKLAIAHVADRDRALPETTRLHAPDARRARDGELAGGHIPRNGDAFRARWIVAADRYRRGLRPEADRFEADGHFQRGSG